MYLSILPGLNILRSRGATGTLGEKQLHLVGYLMELSYDLCIALKNNVSENPGFESFLGYTN